MRGSYEARPAAAARLNDRVRDSSASTIEGVLYVLCSSGLGVSKLLLTACALNLFSIVGSGMGLTSDLVRGCDSQARPAAFRPLGGPLPRSLCFMPFFSDRRVVLMGFRESGLGLLEFLADDGIGRAGGAPSPADGGIEVPLPLLRMGRSDMEAGGIVVLPDQVLEPVLVAGIDLLVFVRGLARPRSDLLSLKVTNKSTRSLH